MPTPAEREAARALVSWRGLELDTTRRHARLAVEGMGVDLGGIGKGMALDSAAVVLRLAGTTRGLLNFGGEVLAIGAWDISVADPRDRMRPAFQLTLRDAALSTSAQTERGFTAGGRRFGHIIDPRTGEPVPFAGSVSALAPTGTDADALSTALLVMGREAAAQFVARRPGIGVLWIEPAGKKLQAWKWNLETVEAVQERSVAWMN